MTWIVGTAQSFGKAIVASDIQVTFQNASGVKKYADCVQKIYPLGNSLLGGFAGSVKIGFNLLTQLTFESSKLAPNEAWTLDIIANTWWPRVAKRIFARAEEAERNCGSQIILAAAHPTKNRGDTAGWAWTDVYIFKSPNFKPIKVADLKCAGIGSGAHIPSLSAMVESVVGDFSFVKMVTMGEFVQSRFLADSMHGQLRENPIPGISNLFQVGTVIRGKVSIHNHELTYVDDSSEIQIRFPKLAQSYKEFLDFCSQNRKVASAAIC